jgi:hypothetical protein
MTGTHSRITLPSAGDLMMPMRQTGRFVLVGQALLVAGLAVAGLVAAAGSPTGVGHVAGFSLNIPHSLLLLTTAGASVLAAPWSRIGRFWAMAQSALYTLVYVIGTAASTGHSQDTWLRLNTPDHFLHLGLALVSGVLSPALFWPTAPGAHAPARIMPGEPPPTEQRPPRSVEEEPAETREMIAAEVAVTEGSATPEQARRVQEDAQHRADTEHRRAWKQYEE